MGRPKGSPETDHSTRVPFKEKNLAYCSPVEMTVRVQSSVKYQRLIRHLEAHAEKLGIILTEM